MTLNENSLYNSKELPQSWWLKWIKASFIEREHMILELGGIRNVRDLALTKEVNEEMFLQTIGLILNSYFEDLYDTVSLKCKGEFEDEE